MRQCKGQHVLHSEGVTGRNLLIIKPWLLKPFPHLQEIRCPLTLEHGLRKWICHQQPSKLSKQAGRRDAAIWRQQIYLYEAGKKNTAWGRKKEVTGKP